MNWLSLSFLMRLCIQLGLCFNQSLFTPSHSSSYLPAQPSFFSFFFPPPFFFSFHILSWLLLCGSNLVKKYVRGTTGALDFDSVVKPVAMETQNRRNVENLLRFFIFLILSSASSQSENVVVVEAAPL